jgi:hypothetical protein
VRAASVVLGQIIDRALRSAPTTLAMVHAVNMALQQPVPGSATHSSLYMFCLLQ